jgi:hypothetical protein
MSTLSDSVAAFRTDTTAFLNAAISATNTVDVNLEKASSDVADITTNIKAAVVILNGNPTVASIQELLGKLGVCLVEAQTAADNISTLLTSLIPA